MLGKRGGASTQPAAAPPWSAPSLARPQNLSSKQRETLFLLLPFLFSLLICSESERGWFSPHCRGGLGAGSWKPSPPGQVVEEKVGEQDEKKCY